MVWNVGWLKFEIVDAVGESAVGAVAIWRNSASIDGG
jgi:hypothetical protein